MFALTWRARCAATAGLEGVDVRCTAEELAQGETSVGPRVSFEHLTGSPVGARLTVRAELVHLHCRLVRSQVLAERDDGTAGHGEITRVIVDTDRFMSRAET